MDDIEFLFEDLN